MKNKKQKEDWHLKIARNVLEMVIKEQDSYYTSHHMAKVCDMLEGHCKKQGDRKQAQHFKNMEKLFRKLYKDKQKKFGRICVSADPKEEFIVDSSNEFKTFTQVIDLQKYKGEKCICTYRRDGTVDVQFSTVTINVPKRKFELWEEQKQ